MDVFTRERLNELLDKAHLKTSDELRRLVEEFGRNGEPDRFQAALRDGYRAILAEREKAQT